MPQPFQSTIPSPAMDFPPPLNPNHIFINSSFAPSSSEFEPSDYLLLDDASDEAAAPVAVTGGSSIGATPMMNTTTNMECKDGAKRKKTDLGFRVAFKTKSDLEIMDDGFKWRKYGKKSVKNSPNPRNYYKCASGGCNVKKRVERDREDSSYVITTYEGVHNHESPCVVYYDQVPLMVSSNAWTLQASSQSSSS
ncbi:hypothetical protein VitviT2T_011127 [Vitis vinifera]|uniref:WRKY domain-containing protein n=2 Tax=Vitis vinifera TaxID=29760 RepID=A0ABY9CBH2_VITVI|eukprot:XP_010652864.1 PREDICTED: probable WRKY transcription factor 51 [Vitis vinifera]